MKKLFLVLIVFGLSCGGSVLASGGYTINTILPSLTVSPGLGYFASQISVGSSTPMYSAVELLVTPTSGNGVADVVIQGYSSPKLVVRNDGNSTLANSAFGITTDGTYSHFGRYSISNTFAAYLMSIQNSSGAIGMGTTTPAGYKLTVDGAIMATETIVATSTSMTLNWQTSETQVINMGADAITVAFSKVQPGDSINVMACNPVDVSSGTLTFTAPSILWPDGTTPTHTTTASKCDSYTFKATYATSTASTGGTSSANVPIIMGSYIQNY